jgi:XTP/dITP diphosphohydrolase
MKPLKVFLATANEGKKREFELLLPPTIGWELHLCSELGQVSWQEVGTTYTENATIKAKAVKALTAFSVIADDSGLEVDFLQGAPGVHSARFAGEGSTDAQNIDKLLQALKGVPPSQRSARFVCTLVFIDASGKTLSATGKCEGLITTARRGQQGFGYDPIFEVTGTGKTMAELTKEEKNRISHRSAAVKELLNDLGTPDWTRIR